MSEEDAVVAAADEEDVDIDSAVADVESEPIQNHALRDSRAGARFCCPLVLLSSSCR